ncbi:MAG: hypothetical protein [Podoviridae sp. ctDWo9]|nr:MAG: hypothetical protein [Podoviridae sp. ctDWo9]
MDSREMSIVTQVCAKLAADLTVKTEDTQETANRFGVLLALVTEMVFDSIESRTGGATATIIKAAFPNATEVETPSTGGAVTVQGSQHGELPSWLITACRRDGVTRVFDNRDRLSENPKRPWFKAVGADKAYWAPKGKVN